jgi:hypothetical protein
MLFACRLYFSTGESCWPTPKIRQQIWIWQPKKFKKAHKKLSIRAFKPVFFIEIEHQIKQIH